MLTATSKTCLMVFPQLRISFWDPVSHSTFSIRSFWSLLFRACCWCLACSVSMFMFLGNFWIVHGVAISYSVFCCLCFRGWCMRVLSLLMIFAQVMISISTIWLTSIHCLLLTRIQAIFSDSVFSQQAHPYSTFMIAQLRTTWWMLPIPIQEWSLQPPSILR